MDEIESLQDCLSDWWIAEPSKELKPGRLVWLYYPYINLIPYEFIATGRVDNSGRPESTNHNNLSFNIRQFRMSEGGNRSRLPVSPFPKQDNEVYLISRAKKRPAIVIAKDNTGFKLIDELKHSKSWKNNPSLIVAPYYGTEKTKEREGFHPNFVKRVRLCEYPELMYDRLPLNTKKTQESLLFLKHMTAIGRHHEAVGPTEYCLSEDALLFFEEQLKWYFFNEFDSDGFIADFRKQVPK